MKIGKAITFRGQRYTCVGQFETEYRPGWWIPIFELASRCPTCGDAFTATASRTQIRRRKLVRRCKPCRRLRLGPVAPQRSNLPCTSVAKKSNRKAIAPKLKRPDRARTHAQRPPGGAPSVTAARPLGVLPETMKTHPRASLSETSLIIWRSPGRK